MEGVDESSVPVTKVESQLNDDNHGASPSAKLLYEILIRTSPIEVETALSSSAIPPTHDILHDVLKLSYNNPSAAATFFRWARRTHKPTTFAWNLMVDLLGKNREYDAMWDPIRSMKEEGVLSTATFVSVFESYCMGGKYSEAIMSFDVMNKYGIEQDIVAVNSLLSAICREDNQTGRAFEFFDKIKSKIPPNGDTFAIFLEGWEREGNVAKAKTTFGEMVIRVGWSPENTQAYDAFLTTLVRGSRGDEAVKFLQVMRGKNCLPGLSFFTNALHMLIRQNDSAHAVPLWDIMVGSGFVPNLIMYNVIIGLLCNNNDINKAFLLFDEMIFDGAFPDFLTYYLIFRCLIKNKKTRQVGKFFYEMIKNESPPTPFDCSEAITLLFDGDDPEMATEIWNYMVENHVSPLEESASAFLIGLCNMDRLTEVMRFAEDILDRRIKIPESTVGKLKNALYKDGRSGRERYDSFLRKWKNT